MPAAAVANRTPSTGGISGKDAGASGEMLVDMFVIPGHARHELGIHNHDRSGHPQ
jgi:hypothetical protein